MILQGIVSAFNQRKGWGFIKTERGDYFFHLSNSTDFHPTLGVKVEFELSPPFRLGQREQAANARVIAESAVKAGE